jgi:tetratricopeptide (TPR) repeat protein
VATAAIEAQPDFQAGRVLLGLVELAAGRYAEVERWLAPLIAQSPQNDQVGDLYVQALEGMGRIDEAAETLQRRERALADAGRAADATTARLARALLLARAERWPEVAQVATTLRASADPEERDRGTLLLVDSLARRGQSDAALTLLADADPDRPALLARRAELRLDAGQAAEAATDLAALQATTDGDLRVAEIYQRREDYARSIPLLEARRTRDPGSLETEFRLASAYERVARIPEAVALFQQVIERAPSFAPALNYLGYLWIERSENLEQALGMVREAVRLDPDNGSYVDSLGWAFFKLGRFPEAIDYLERAVRLLPDDSTVLEHLGDAHLAVGDRVKAREAYRRAVARGGDAARAAADKLEHLGGES